ncbi:MAG: CinA family protein [Pseudomonadota bacterium]|nr:CinA family protein [Pseudomonadota bacterium]
MTTADPPVDLLLRLTERLKGLGWRVATAESCTGGLVAAALTHLPGSSAWFDRGWVTYTNAAKVGELGVPTSLLEVQGAVSEAVVCAMVAGALARSDAAMACAVSGVAGPGGGTETKPVGTVWMGCGIRGGATRAWKEWFAGDRSAVRQAAVDAVLQEMLAQCPVR